MHECKKNQQSFWNDVTKVLSWRELEGEVWVMRIGRRRMMMIRRRMRRKMEECEDYLVLSARWRR